MSYEVWDISDWPALHFATQGSAAKKWVIPPDADCGEPEWLWKEIRVETTGRKRPLGHDWGERVGGEVAKKLGVPTHIVELGTREGRRGVVCRSFASSRAGHPILYNANALLPNVIANYNASKSGEVAGYNLAAVFEVLERVNAPTGSMSSVTNAQAAFAGILVLDALIANQDRHHENWGVLQDRLTGETFLSPAFDQACCLGYQESEDRKERLLQEGQVGHWARKGRSNQFEGRPNLVDLALDCLRRLEPTVSSSWVQRLEAVQISDMEDAVHPTPDHLMSQVDRSFAIEVMHSNQRRILDGWASCD